MNEICRTCLTESKESNLVNINNKMVGDVAALELVIKIASIEVLRNDPLPKVMCRSCIEKLQLFHEFRQVILNSDEILKTKLCEKDNHMKNFETNTQYVHEPISSSEDLDVKNEVIKHEEIFIPDHSDEDINNSSRSSYFETDTSALQKIKNRRMIYECKECDKVFKKAYHYKVHMTKHTGEKRYACEFCPKRFARSYVLVYHRRVHTGERPYTCEICSKSFSSPSNFYTHKKIHSGKKNYKCELCDESFIQSASLKIHIRRIHTGERPFLCEICSSAFRSNSSLLTHKLDLHGEKEACPLCNKLYSSRVLKEHIRRHKEQEQGIKRFACEECGKRFTCSSSRKKHLLIHSGEKPYSCDVCKKSFNQRSALKTHMRVHSDFMPFQCDFCSKSFRYKHHLRSHNNTHHKENLQQI